MSGTSNRLKTAEARLARAIGRLETAFDAGASRTAAPDPALANELSRLQSENAELRALVGQAAERLDATIAKFQAQVDAEAAAQAKAKAG